MVIHQGWLNKAEKHPSPNFYNLPSRQVSLLVIHNISLPPNQYGGPYIDQLFTNRLNPEEHPYFAQISHLKVASHLLITRDGIIKQYVSFNDCAHHAGDSSFQGQNKCNDFSIGIELEGSDNAAFTEIQYKKLSEVTVLLLSQYPKVTIDRIVGHCDIAPGRKTDPGPFFDWEKFKKSLGPADILSGAR